MLALDNLISSKDIEELIVSLPPLSKISEQGILRHVFLEESLYLFRFKRNANKTRPLEIRYEFMSDEQTLWYPPQGAGGGTFWGSYCKVKDIVSKGSLDRLYGIPLENEGIYYRLTEISKF